VVADDEGDAGIAELLQFGLLQGLGGLQFKVDQVEPCTRGFGKNLDLRGKRSGKLPAIRCASTGRDTGGDGVVREESAKNCFSFGRASRGFSR
jgi:hypothetical protein